MKASMLSLIVFVISLFLKDTQASAPSFIYTERVTFFIGNTIPKLNDPSGYSVPIVWQIAQTKIVNSSYYLMGWKISTADKWLSYDASLNSVTLTGANLYFNPSTFSEVIQINFGIVLLTSQSGLIRLIYYEHNTCSLGILGITSEPVYVPIGVTFRADTASYKVMSYLSSFTVTFAGATKTLSVNTECNSIVAGSSDQIIRVWTRNHIIPKIAITYFMLDLMSYPFTPFVYTETCTSWGNGPNIAVPLLYEPRTSRNCMIGVSGIDSVSLASSNKIVMTPSVDIDFTRMYEISSAGISGWVVRIVCTKKNPICQYDCQICSDNITCLQCFWGWSVTGGCTNITDCVQVDPNSTLINKCTKCATPKVLAFGVCIDTYGCAYVNYTWNSSGFYSSCSSCDTTLGFSLNPINQRCLCMPNSTFNKTAKDVCIPCPINCVLCDELNGKTKCLNCIQQYIPNYPLNISCLLIPPNCTSITQISTQSSCTSCEDKFFLTISPTSIYLNVCSPCLVDCLTCNSGNQCLSCLNGGFPIKGGCSLEKNCVQVRANDTSLQKCIRCSSQYYLITGLCTNISGCTATYLFRNQVICLACNTQLNFLMVPKQNKCMCKQAFRFDSILQSCQQICGDGILLNHSCDDGNTENNDGCSQHCDVEKDFACVNDGPNSTSRCVYLRFNVILKVKSITKKFLENRAIFTFTIVPFLSLYKRINQSESYSLTSNRSMSNLSFNFQKDQIAIEVQFMEDLQAFEASLQIQLPKGYFLQKKAQLSFFMVSNDTKLIIVKQRQKMVLFSQIEDICSVVNLCLFLLGSVIHKMIGLQTLLPLQIIYLTHLLNEQRTPSYGIFGFLAKSAFNFNYQQNHCANIRSNNPFTFSSQNEEATAIIILLISIIVCTLSIFGVIVTIKNSQSKDQKQETKSKLKRQIGSKIKEVLFILCKNSIFTLSFGIFCVFWPLFISHITINKESFSVWAQTIALTVVLLAIVTFTEWKYYFIQRQQISQQIQKPSQKWERKYIPLFLSFLFVISILLCTGFIKLIPVEALLTSTVVAYELILIFYRPYKNGFHNFAILFNNGITLSFLAWNLARIEDDSLREQQNELLAIMSIILLIIVSLIISMVRIIIQLKLLVKQCRKNQDQAETSKSQEQLDKYLNESILVQDNRLKLLPYRRDYFLKCDFDVQRQGLTNFSQRYFRKDDHIEATSYKFLQNMLKSNNSFS